MWQAVALRSIKRGPRPSARWAMLTHQPQATCALLAEPKAKRPIAGPGQTGWGGGGGVQVSQARAPRQLMVMRIHLICHTSKSVGYQLSHSWITATNGSCSCEESERTRAGGSDAARHNVELCLLSFLNHRWDPLPVYTFQGSTLKYIASTLLTPLF